MNIVVDDAGGRGGPNSLAYAWEPSAGSNLIISSGFCFGKFSL